MTLSKTLYFTGLIGSTQASFWDIFRFDRCPDVVPQQNFDMGAFHGQWYEVSRSNNVRLYTGDCVTWDLQDHTDQYKRIDIEPQGMNLYVNQDMPELNQGHMNVKLSEQDWEPDWGNLTVIDTDYSSYALLYSCFSGGWGAIHEEMYWVLSRDPNNYNYAQSHANIAFSEQLSDYNQNDMAQTLQGEYCTNYEGQGVMWGEGDEMFNPFDVVNSINENMNEAEEEEEFTPGTADDILENITGDRFETHYQNFQDKIEEHHNEMQDRIAEHIEEVQQDIRDLENNDHFNDMGVDFDGLAEHFDGFDDNTIPDFIDNADQRVDEMIDTAFDKLEDSPFPDILNSIEDMPMFDDVVPEMEDMREGTRERVVPMVEDAQERIEEIEVPESNDDVMDIVEGFLPGN